MMSTISCVQPGQVASIDSPRLREAAMNLQRQIPLVEQLLGAWRPQLGDDFDAYRNHVYRVVNFWFALRRCTAEEREKIVAAGCFHDAGIWLARTFDYLSPCVRSAMDYLGERGLGRWMPEGGLMIETHHKLTRHRDHCFPLVEVFRRGDLVDVSLGVVRFGLPLAFVREVRAAFPNARFHLSLVKLAAGWTKRNPLRPLPIVRW